MVIEKQIFLNYFLEGTIEPLSVDSVAGNKTNLASKLAIDKLKTKFNLHGMTWSSVFNFIGIRTSDIITNLFDDWFVFTIGEELYALPATTKSGIPGIMKYYNRWSKGYRGFGTIQENQQIDYLLITPKKDAWSNWTGGCGFLYQVAKFNVYRDENIDNKIDKNNVMLSEGDGFNIHTWVNYISNKNYAKLLNTKSKSMGITTPVANISEGCNCTTYDYWIWLFPILQKYSINSTVKYNLLQF